MLTKSKILKFSIFSIAILSWTLVQAETFYGPTELKDQNFDELTIHGPGDLKSVKVKSLIVHGPLNFEHLEVTEQASLKGPAKGHDGKFQNLSIKGPFKAEKVIIGKLAAWGPVGLKEFKVENEANIHGPLKAETGTFQDVAAGSKNGGESVELNAVMAKNVVINEGRKEEVLVLSGKTTISGNIIFKSGRGQIAKNGRDVVIQGKIEGVIRSDELKK